MDWLSILPSIFGAGSSILGNFNANANARMNAREARQWEEDMYNKYNSPSAMVRQYEEAGLNPALMYGNAPIAAPTDTAAAETMAPNTGTLTEMLGQMLQLQLFGEDYEAKRLENENKRIKNERDRFDLEIERQFAVFEHQYSISEAIARINSLEENTELTKYEREVIGPLRSALLRAQSRGENVRAAIDEWKKDYIDKYNADPDADPLKQALTSLLEDLNNPKRQERRERRQQRNLDQRTDGGWTNTD